MGGVEVPGVFGAVEVHLRPQGHALGGVHVLAEAQAADVRGLPLPRGAEGVDEVGGLGLLHEGAVHLLVQQLGVELLDHGAGGPPARQLGELLTRGLGALAVPIALAELDGDLGLFAQHVATGFLAQGLQAGEAVGGGAVLGPLPTEEQATRFLGGPHAVVVGVAEHVGLLRELLVGDHVPVLDLEQVGGFLGEQALVLQEDHGVLELVGEGAEFLLELGAVQEAARPVLDELVAALHGVLSEGSFLDRGGARSLSTLGGLVLDLGGGLGRETGHLDLLPILGRQFGVGAVHHGGVDLLLGIGGAVVRLGPEAHLTLHGHGIDVGGGLLGVHGLHHGAQLGAQILEQVDLVAGQLVRGRLGDVGGGAAQADDLPVLQAGPLAALVPGDLQALGEGRVDRLLGLGDGEDVLGDGGHLGVGGAVLVHGPELVEHRRQAGVEGAGVGHVPEHGEEGVLVVGEALVGAGVGPGSGEDDQRGEVTLAVLEGHGLEVLEGFPAQLLGVRQGAHLELDHPLPRGVLAEVGVQQDGGEVRRVVADAGGDHEDVAHLDVVPVAPPGQGDLLDGTLGLGVLHSLLHGLDGGGQDLVVGPEDLVGAEDRVVHGVILQVWER